MSEKLSPQLYEMINRYGNDYSANGGTMAPTGQYGGQLQPSSFGSGMDQVSAGGGSLTSQDRAPASGGYKDMAKGAAASMNSGGSLGSALTGAGIYGMMSEAGTASAAAGPWALGAGLAMSAYEQNQQANAMTEQAKIQEEQQRKQNTQSAINQLINVTRGLGV